MASRPPIPAYREHAGRRQAAGQRRTATPCNASAKPQQSQHWFIPLYTTILPPF